MGFAHASYFDQPLNSWDASNVQDMSGMFFVASSFNQPLNSWDVSNVQNMSRMFAGASSFNQPLNTWDVSNVQDMSDMFHCYAESSFNQPLNSWDVSNVQDMRRMFYSAKAFDQTLCWEVSEKDTLDMFGSGDACIDSTCCSKCENDIVCY